jgi:mannobiose 2-epimerase
MQLAESVLQHGMSLTGDYIVENRAASSSAEELVWWWPQVEGMVGFYHAYQITGDEKYLNRVMRLWDHIQNHFIDKEQGGWFKIITSEGKPFSRGYKIGPWEGPYHHTRACLEITDRISAS